MKLKGKTMKHLIIGALLLSGLTACQATPEYERERLQAERENEINDLYSPRFNVTCRHEGTITVNQNVYQASYSGGVVYWYKHRTTQRTSFSNSDCIVTVL